MTLILGLALAAPPLPTWTATDVEPAGPVEEAVVSATTAEKLRPASTSTSSFESQENPHGWADEAALTFDISGDVGRFYYVMATAREADLVAHWRQGPIAGEDLSRTFELAFPVELPSLLERVGGAHLSLVLVTTDKQDREIGRVRLGTTRIQEQEGRILGAVVQSWEEQTTGGWQ